MCGYKYPGLYWLGLIYDYYKRKGHLIEQCYNNLDSPNYKGSKSDIIAIFVAVDKKMPINN